MRVLLLHNRYQQAGGECVAVQAERELLESHGHEVNLIEADNSLIVGFGGRVKAALGTIYSPAARANVAKRVASFQPDVAHVHNFFPLFSPSIYYACHEAGIPVVQTLHNYRVICPNAQLLRGGKVCEDCVGKGVPWPGVLHACYRGSRAGTAAVAAMATVHRWIGTWNNMVSAFIALTSFSREKLVQGGIAAQKVFVKPNFVPAPEVVGNGRGGFALFVGRLTPEKGIAALLSVWGSTKRTVPLKVAGDGPLGGEVAKIASGAHIEYLGAQPREKIQELMREAAFLVFPSIWYEGLPMVIIEAFSVGLPVLASNLGSMASVVEHGRTGLHFRPRDAEDLAAKVEWTLANPEKLDRMRREARAEYLAKYTPERNYEMLMRVYRYVIDGKKSETIDFSRSEIVG